MVNQWAPIYLKKNQKFEYIDELASGSIPALILKKAFSMKTCKKITEKILDFNYITNGPGIKKKIGVSLNSFINQKGIYFEKTRFIEKTLEQYFPYNEDPRITMQNLLSIVFSMETEIAKENNSNYSKGVFRFHGTDESFKIHRDSAHYEAIGYQVSKFPLQFSAVLHLQPAEYGGELVIYKKIWKHSDEKYRTPYFGYSEKVVHDIESIKIKPEIGDIVIINPVHYHAISKIKGKYDRISVGFFFAPTDEQTLACWA